MLHLQLTQDMLLLSYDIVSFDSVFFSSHILLPWTFLQVICERRMRKKNQNKTPFSLLPGQSPNYGMPLELCQYLEGNARMQEQECDIILQNTITSTTSGGFTLENIVKRYWLSCQN